MFLINNTFDSDISGPAQPTCEADAIMISISSDLAEVSESKIIKLRLQTLNTVCKVKESSP